MNQQLLKADKITDIRMIQSWFNEIAGIKNPDKMNVGKNATIKDVINATNWLLVTVEINNPRKSEININTDDIIKSQKTEPLNGTSNNKIPAITVKAMEIIPKIK